MEREVRNVFKDRAAAETARTLGPDRLNEQKPVTEWDASALLKLMWDAWNQVFRLIR